MTEALQRCRMWMIALILCMPFAGALFAYAWWGRLWTDEAWYYYSAHLNGLGAAPYTDYFTHRLALWEDIHGVVLRVFGDSLQTARFASSVCGALCIVVLAYVLLRLTGRWYYCAVGLGVMWNMELFQGFSTASVYALPGLLFALSCLCLLELANRPLISSGLFLLFQGAIWAMRYPVDVQLVVVVVFLSICSWRLRSSAWSLGLLICCAVAAPVWACRSWILSGNYAVWADTVTFNFGQLDYVVRHNLLPESLKSRFARIAYLRPLEVKAYLPALVIGLACVPWVLRGLRKRLTGWIGNGEDNVVLYATVFCGGYYVFFLLSAFDWPVTKVYLLPALAILAGVFAKSLLAEVVSKVRGTVLFILLAVLACWPFIQGTERLSRHYSARQILAVYEAELAQVLRPGASVFTFNLFLAQMGYKLEPAAGLEVYSLAHEYDDNKAAALWLLTPNRMLEKIRSREYDALVLEEDRFYKDNGDMSRLLNPIRREFFETVERQYYLTKTFRTPFRGTVYVFVLKPKPDTSAAKVPKSKA